MPSVPFDPSMPALQELFPTAGAPDFVAQMVQELAGTAIDPETVEVSYVRYRPTRNCAVLWSVPGPSGRSLLVSGILRSDGIGNRIARRSFQQLAELVTAGLGGKVCPYKYLPDLQLLLQAYPLDMQLQGLALAASKKCMNAILCQASGLPSDGALVTEIVPVSYKPWRRCVLKYLAQVQDRPVKYFGKVFRDDRGEPMVARLNALNAELARSRAPWKIATPIMYVPEARMLLLAAMEQSFEMSALLKDAVHNHQAKDTLRDQITKLADGLLYFQSMVVAGLDCVTPQDVLNELDDELDGLLQIVPVLASRMEVQLRSLELAASRLPVEVPVLSHGALRYNQFLRRGDTLIALDLDGLCLSGPSADAGEFLAYFDLTAFRSRRLRSIIPECQEVFLDVLMRAHRLDRRWIDWYRAAAIIKWAQRTFFSLNPRWPELTEGLLLLAEHTLRRLPAGMERLAHVK